MEKNEFYVKYTFTPSVVSLVVHLRLHSCLLFLWTSILHIPVHFIFAPFSRSSELLSRTDPFTPSKESGTCLRSICTCRAEHFRARIQAHVSFKNEIFLEEDRDIVPRAVAARFRTRIEATRVSQERRIVSLRL